jgi:flagellar FliJ protein
MSHEVAPALQYLANPIRHMKKFIFPLRSVATLRKLRETERRELFATAVHAYVQAEEALSVVNARIAELQEIIAGERVVRFRASAQVAFMHALHDEQVLKNEAVALVGKTRLEMEKERQLWMEARRDVRLVEVLEAKARGAHRREYEREEQALLDDRTNALAARAD